MSRSPQQQPVSQDAGCCPRYHDAVELIGKRWTGAILVVMLEAPRLRFSEIASVIPELSDRLLSQRVKELEARGLVARTVDPGPPLRVTYELTEMGLELGPALGALKDWAQKWLGEQLPGAAGLSTSGPTVLDRSNAAIL